jgi:hypothetical protein
MGQSLQVPRDRNQDMTIRDPEGNLIILSHKGWEA